jgi:AraC family transcriptional regulator, arabinose operon regulatory protein
MLEKGDLRTDIQILRTTGPLLGFKVVKLDQLIPELFELGERRAAAQHRYLSEAPKYSTTFYVAEGTHRIGFDNGAEIALKPGSVAFLPPNCRYWQQYGPEPTHRVLWVGFELSAIATRHPEWNLSKLLQRVHFAHDSTHLERFFRQIIREATTPSILRTSGLRLALDTLLLEIVRDIVEPSKISSLISMHPAISKTLGILETRFKKNWTLVELAEEVGISRSRLAELFTLEVGSSIHRFLNKVRVRHAEALLTQSNLSIGEIALECGFATIQHFSRIFKEVNGQAPINFRRRSEYRGIAEPRVLSKAS